MAVRQRGQSWQVSVTINGTRYRKDFPTKVQAETAEEEAKEAAKAGKAPPWAGVQMAGDALPTEATLMDVLRLVERTDWAQKRTRYGLVKRAEDVVRSLGNPRPRMVTEDALDDFVAECYKRGNCGGTINRKLAALSKILDKARRKRLLVAVPDMPWQPDARQRDRYYTPEEEAEQIAFWRRIEEHAMADMVAVNYDTGARRNELLELRPGDIVDNASRVRLITYKGGGVRKPRLVPLTERAKEILVNRARNCGPKDRLFEPLGESQVEYLWKLMRRHTGHEHDEDYVLHCVRHTYASRLVQRGVALAVIKELMGHANIKTTLRYAHLAPENMTAALAALEGPKAPAVVAPPRAMTYEEYTAWAQEHGVPVPAQAAE